MLSYRNAEIKLPRMVHARVYGPLTLSLKPGLVSSPANTYIACTHAPLICMLLEAVTFSALINVTGKCVFHIPCVCHDADRDRSCLVTSSILAYYSKGLMLSTWVRSAFEMTRYTPNAELKLWRFWKSVRRVRKSQCRVFPCFVPCAYYFLLVGAAVNLITGRLSCKLLLAHFVAWPFEPSDQFTLSPSD